MNIHRNPSLCRLPEEIKSIPCFIQEANLWEDPISTRREGMKTLVYMQEMFEQNLAFLDAIDRKLTLKGL